VTPPAVTSRVAARRAAWGVGDQAVSSLTNFALLVVAARSLDPAEFGALAIALAAYGIALGITRALCGEPLAVCYSATSVQRVSSEARGALATAAAAGVTCGCVSALVGVVLGGALGTALIVLAVVIPGLVIQDTWRFAFFAMGRARAACANDVVWLLALGLLLVAVGSRSLTAVLLAWGLGGSIAAIVAIAQARFVPDPRRIGGWLRRHAHLWPRYVMEFLTVTAGWQAALLGLGVIAGLAAVGALRAGQVLLGPLNVAFLAVPLVAVPESARLWRAGRGSPARHGAWVSATLASLALVWGLLVALIPDEVGQDLLGASWTAARSLLAPLVVVMVLMGMNLGWFCALRVLGAARESLGVRLVSAPLVLAFAMVGGALDGAEGAAWGWALAGVVAVPLWWRAVKRASRAPNGDLLVEPLVEPAGVGP
jgi:O-antigen/teichoic acid export membrane protein